MGVAVALPTVADDDPTAFTIRKSTVVRGGIAVLVVAVLGGAIAIGLSVRSSPPTKYRVIRVEIAPRHTTTTTSVGPLPRVESCTDSPGAVVLRPTSIGFGCAGLDTTVTAITWAEWAPVDAVGVGTLNQDTCVPDCATGSHNMYRVDVVLSNPGTACGTG